MTQDKIPILTVYDKEYEDLYQAFFKQSFNLHEMHKYFTLLSTIIPTPSNIEDYGYVSKRYVHARIFQINNIISFIKQNINNSQTYAISSDVDIVFYKGFTPHVSDLLRSNDDHIFFMSEDLSFQKPNFGLIIFPINQSSLSFFQELKILLKELNITEKKSTFNINDLLSQVLLETKTPYKILGAQFGNGHLICDQKLVKAIRSDLLCAYHATASYDVMEKIKRLSLIVSIGGTNSPKVSDVPYLYWEWERIIRLENQE